MNIHFIAIGGAIMHNLAICLKNLAHNITGSDDIIFDPSKTNLERNNLLPARIGFFKDNINEKLDAIILGMHAKKDNIELLAAKEKGIKIYSFPEFIYEQSKDKKRVVIAGSHGKTTTTAMIMHVLKDNNIKFDYLVGASLDGFERGVELTDAPLIILEGDEYLSSPIEMRSKFHYYKADIALITGIAWDHINVFPTLESYHNTFKEFIEDLDKKSSLKYFNEDFVLNNLVKKAKCKTESYSTPKYSIDNGATLVEYDNESYKLNVFGKHNLQNMEGAKKVCKELDISYSQFYKSIASFKGAARRLEKLKTKDDIIAFKDFAHSPSKLKATVNAVSEQFEDRKLIACMELHTFSSTNSDFIIEFEGSMNKADTAIIYMSEKAFEIKNREKISDKTIQENFKKNNILIFRKAKQLKKFILNQNLNKSVLLLMTSGNFDGIDWNDVLD
ncbi:MAG: peptidoglycan synthetase [Methanosarcinales archaeon]|nr:peptidoglycan synthetase [Methanosarcinales archaeon]